MTACYVCEAKVSCCELCTDHWELLPKSLHDRLEGASLRDTTDVLHSLLPGVAIFLRRRSVTLIAEWRSTPVLPGAQVSSLGQVLRPEGRLSPWQINSNLYPMVSLGGKARFVHKLVAEAFLGPCPEGYEVDHRDRDPLNPSLDNLRHLTLGDNSERARRREKLTDSERAEIKRLAPERSLHWLAARFDITGQTARIVARHEVAMKPGTLAKREACLAKNRGKSRGVA